MSLDFSNIIDASFKTVASKIVNSKIWVDDNNNISFEIFPLMFKFSLYY